MYKRIDFTQLGGAPIDQDSFDWMQSSYRDALSAIAAMFGNKVIVTGMAVAGGNIADGWLVYNGSLMPFTGGALGAGSIVVQEVNNGDVDFQNNDTHTVEFKQQAVLGGPATFNYSDLVRLPLLKEIWLKGDVKEVDCDADYIAANFDESGLGINERTGWAVCNGSNGTKNRGGRVSIGYSTVTVDPDDNVWDVIYNTIGSTGGEKDHTLSVGEMPDHQHDIVNGGFLDKGAGDGANVVGSEGGSNHEKTGHAGGGQAHENRSPFIVSLFIQKL